MNKRFSNTNPELDVHSPKSFTMLRGPAFKKPPTTLTNDAEIAQWALDALYEQHVSGAMPCGSVRDGIEPAKGDDFYLEAFLIASVMTGPDWQRLARMFGIPQNRAKVWADNLSRAGFWREGKVYFDHWFDPVSGLVGFLADSLVALGLVEVVCFDKEGARYAPVAGRGVRRSRRG